MLNKKSKVEDCQLEGRITKVSADRMIIKWVAGEDWGNNSKIKQNNELMYLKKYLKKNRILITDVFFLIVNRYAI